MGAVVPLVCAVVTVLCLLGVWGALDEMRRMRRASEAQARLTAETLAVVQVAVAVVRLAVEYPQQGATDGRGGHHADRGPNGDPGGL